MLLFFSWLVFVLCFWALLFLIWCDAAAGDTEEGRQAEQLMVQEEDNMDLPGDGMLAQQHGPAGDGEETNPTQYNENRLKMLDSLRSVGVDPYPHKFEVVISITDYVTKYSSLGIGQHLLTVTESLAGKCDRLDIRGIVRI